MPVKVDPYPAKQTSPGQVTRRHFLGTTAPLFRKGGLERRIFNRHDVQPCFLPREGTRPTNSSVIARHRPGNPETTTGLNFNVPGFHCFCCFENVQGELFVNLFEFCQKCWIADTLRQCKRPERGTATIGHGQIDFLGVIGDTFFL